LLQYGESCERYAGHSFPLLPMLGSCTKISSGANVVRYLSANSTVDTAQTGVAFTPSF
jgi:hypothetical protein